MQKYDLYPESETEWAPREDTDEFIEEEANAFLQWMENPNSLYFKTFALSRGYHSQRLVEWAKINERFSEVYELALEWQESKLVEGGLMNKLNAGLVKFVLINNHGWMDKPEEAPAQNTHTYYVNYGAEKVC